MQRLIVFWHRGNSWYLNIAIRQAEKYNDNVILLGDENNKTFSSNFLNMDKLPKEKYEEFKGVYKNLSFNDLGFELRCFERYFYVLEYLKKYNIEEIILCDSDLLIFDNLSDYFSGKKRAFSHTCTEPDGMSLSPHCSLWNKSELQDFCDFLISYYSNNLSDLENIFEEYKIMHSKGGICDMTLLYLWVKKKGLDYYNTAMNQGDALGVIDHIISVPDNGKKNEYKFQKLTGVKKVRFNNLYPYFISNEGHKEVKAVALHCSGGYKIYMKAFAKGTSNVWVLLILRVKLELEKRVLKR